MGRPNRQPWDSGWMVLPPLLQPNGDLVPQNRRDQVSAALELIRHATGGAPWIARDHPASVASEIVAVIMRAHTLSGHSVSTAGGHDIAFSWVWSGIPSHLQTLAVRLRVGTGLWQCHPCDGICDQATWEWSAALTRPALARDPWHPLMWHPADPARPSDTVAWLSYAIAMGRHLLDAFAWRALSDAYRDCGLDAQAEGILSQVADGLVAPPCLWVDAYDTARGAIS